MLKIPHSLPKISCLMITADGRKDFFVDSFRCYVDQTYPSKELVIVTDAGQEYKDQIIDITSGRDDVRLVFLKGRYTLGALRNISMSVCEGDLFVQWDDDDFNMPDRIMIQYGNLVNSGSTVSYLGDQLHYYFPTQQLYWENWWEYCSNFNVRYGLIPGTLMAYRDGFPAKYPSSGSHAKAGEDSILSDSLCLNPKVKMNLVRNKGSMQVYSFHGRNVWDISHHLNLSKWRSHDIAFMNRHRQEICRTLKYMNFSHVVKVMGREGLAFIYGAEDDV